MMLNFEVYYNNGYYYGTSKVYAIDTIKDRFLIVNTQDRFLWVDIEDCTIEKENKND